MYYKHFGLNGPPFSLSSSSAPLYLSSGHREGMAALQWGLREPSGFTMLVGDIGTGKTTLVHALLANRSAAAHSAFVTSPTLSFEEILQVIAGQLGYTPAGTGKLELIQALDAFVATLGADESAALIFDEAQDLSDQTLEELRLLSNSPIDVNKRLQIVLVGQLELARRLERPELRQLNQRIGARALLPTLRPDEVAEYVEYRLRAQGGDVRKLFRRDALRELARLSGGIPRRINMICHNAMVLAYAEQDRRISATHVKEAARDYDQLLVDRIPSPSGSAQQPRPGRGRLIELGAALSLGAAALALLYALTPRALSLAPTTHRSGTAAPLVVHELTVPAASDNHHDLDTAAGTSARARADTRLAAAAITDESPGPNRGGISKVAVHGPLLAETQPRPALAEHRALTVKTAPAAVAKAKSDSAVTAAADTVTAAATPPTPAQATVVVRRGDTLSKIALRHYGDTPMDILRREIATLIKTNPGIADANHIYPGQIIRLQEVSKINLEKVSK
jgi:type II secretory pathway predicted ATPase ExeA/phage tail protein X